MSRGVTRTRTALTPVARRASICSVTLMAPSSAVMPAPTRPPTSNAVITGAASRTMERATVGPM